MPRSEKSLGFLCQKFVILFLEAPVRTNAINYICAGIVTKRFIMLQAVVVNYCVWSFHSSAIIQPFYWLFI